MLTCSDPLVADFTWHLSPQIDTTQTGTNAVVGAYAARPSASYGNPVAFAVLSSGDAYVRACLPCQIASQRLCSFCVSAASMGTCCC